MFFSEVCRSRSQIAAVCNPNAYATALETCVETRWTNPADANRTNMEAPTSRTMVSFLAWERTNTGIVMVTSAARSMRKGSTRCSLETRWSSGRQVSRMLVWEEQDWSDWLCVCVLCAACGVCMNFPADRHEQTTTPMRRKKGQNGVIGVFLCASVV